MKTLLTDLDVALENILEALKIAGKRAKEANDKSSERNLTSNSNIDFEDFLRNIQGKKDYLLQPKFAKYFENIREELKFTK